ncbi:hypothetical protein Tco_1063027 [Tanacetum coccineum]
MEVDNLKSELEIEKTKFIKVDDLLLEEFFAKDLLHAILLFVDDIDAYSEPTRKYLEKIEECERLETDLSRSYKPKYDKSFAQLEKHLINLELALQNEKEKNVCENSWGKQPLTSGNKEKALKNKMIP